MDYKTAVLTGKSFIEENLLEDLSPYTIASAAGYSVFHYCRLFRECTGESLMGYVRRLRLVLSVREIEQGRPLSDIAVKYGFETVSGFSRAYKRQFGSFPPPERPLEIREKPWNFPRFRHRFLLTKSAPAVIIKRLSGV
ncbi:MAG TPA: AraC family transcriptional regulator [Oscillospiraceae bacterium]|nr:AraC family transcriptional regulator [Oscillospiraceae bacterium]